MNAIDLTNIHLHYGTGREIGEAVLSGADLRVADGEIVGLLGASGAGKSTLLRVIAGLQPPSSGTVVVAGKTTDDDGMRPVPPHLRDCTLVFQDAQLFPHRTVAANVAYGLEAAKVPRAQRRQRVTEVLDMVQISELADRAVTALSGGQAQRVALARCLVLNPAVILFDEPLSALDRGLRQTLAVDIRKLLKQTGTSAIYVTHDPGEATTLADRIAVVEDGKILELGLVGELDSSTLTTSVTRLLGDIGEVSGTVTAVAEQSTTIALVDQHVVLPGRHGSIGDTVMVQLRR